MASTRLAYDASTPGGLRLRRIVASLQDARAGITELFLIAGAFDTDMEALATYLGIPSGSLTALKLQMQRVNAELSGTALQSITIGDQTNTRKLIDSLG